MTDTMTDAHEEETDAFTEFVTTNKANLKQVNGFWFATKKNITFQNKQLFLPIEKVLLLKVVSPFFLEDSQANLKKMIEIKGTQRCGRRRSSKKRKKKQTFLQNRPSLRIIDWFFTNFAKTKRIFINKKDVMHTYNRLLQTHKKTGFDMFSRRHFVLFRNPYEPSQILHTTAAQLHFFQFYIKQNIHAYIEEHLVELQKNMASALKSARSRKMNSNKRKRCTLVNASHQSNGYIITIDHTETTE